MRWNSRIAGRGLLVVFGAVVLLELVLQVGAMALWLGTPDTEPAADGQRRVLCIGDSFTFGMGSTADEYRYPAQLQVKLRESTGEPWSVVASARPGRNSREVLQRIDGQLAAFEPEIVLVLIGLNDRWSRPEPLDLDAHPDARLSVVSDRSFRWRWRTARFVAWAVGKLRDRLSTVPPEPAEGAVHRIEWQIAEDLRVGETGRVPVRLAELRKRLADAPSAELAAALVRGLAVSGNGAAALVEARAALERYPEEPVLWYQLAWESFQEGDLDTATRGIERALELGDALPETWLHRILRGRAVIWRERDPLRSLRSAVELLLAERDPANFRAVAAYPGVAEPDELLREVLPGLEMSAEDAAEVRALFAQAQNPDRAGSARTLEFHLEQIVGRCRAAGAVPLLLTYPTRVQITAEAVGRVAAELGVESVELGGEFVRRLAGQDRSSFFVPDGHCSDAGYELMATILAERVSALVR